MKKILFLFSFSIELKRTQKEEHTRNANILFFFFKNQNCNQKFLRRRRSNEGETRVNFSFQKKEIVNFPFIGKLITLLFIKYMVSNISHPKYTISNTLNTLSIIQSQMKRRLAKLNWIPRMIHSRIYRNSQARQ